jgi:uncharacterized repeat protein (TIGR01451 family)
MNQKRQRVFVGLVTIISAIFGLVLLIVTVTPTVSIVHANSQVLFSEDFTGFAGTGFAPSPVPGQLDSNLWRVLGMSDGDGTFGGTHTTGDFARGTSTGGVTTGGVYAFDVDGAGNMILGVQPGGSDFTPGSFDLRLQNNTGDVIEALAISYQIWVYNDQNRANSLNFAYSLDDVTYTAVPELDYTTPEGADSPPSWFSVDRETILVGFSLNPGDFIYLRWESDDVSGSGSRDEFGIDDIEVTITDPPAITLSKAGPGGALAGGEIVYELTIGNLTTATLTAVTLTDTLPISTTYVADSSGVTPTNPMGNTYVWSLGSLSPTATTTIYLTATIDSGIDPFTVLTNTATVAADFDGNPVNASDNQETTIYPLVSIYDIQEVPDPGDDDASPLVGETVWTEGVATAAPGEIEGSGVLVIQDAAGGPWSGLVVNGDFDGLTIERGDQLRLLGTVVESFGLTRLNSQQVMVLGQTAVPDPELLTTADVPEGNANLSEQWEGVLVEFQDALVTELLSFGEWRFNDGSGIARADDEGSITYQPAVGDRYEYIRGIGWFSFSNYKIQPRDDDDIELFVPELNVTKVGPQAGFVGEELAYSLTLVNSGAISATNVVLTDSLPISTTYVTAVPAPTTVMTDTLVWELGEMAPNLTTTIYLTLSSDSQIPGGAILVNEAILNSDELTDPILSIAQTTLYEIVPIADARAGSNGEIFALEGQVTAANSTWNNAPEWTFQDASGGIAAFFIADPPISLGDTVRMIATRGSFNNQEQMVTPIYYFDVLAAGPPVEPITYTTGQVASGISEGWLVQMEGVVAGMPSSCGSAYNITLNDGSGPATVRIEAATGINLCDLGIQDGDMLGVTGFSTQFQTTYQVKPRSVSDLELFIDAPVVVSTIPTNNATNVLTDTLITIQFSEPVTVMADWFAVHCHISGVISASSSPPDPADTYTITPDDPFINGEICHVTVLADEVSNGAGNNMFNDYRFSFTVGPAPAFGACDDPAIPIHFIQGNGLTTPIFGATVVVEAVVVGSYQGTGQFSGFFLQERDDRVDGDPMTSEGIFVFHSSTAVASGDLVRVRGTATEFNNLTQVASVSNVAVCSTGNTVTPAEMMLPVDDMLAWEAVEGMLVTFTHDLHVTEHFNLGRFGEVHLSVDERLWNPTNIVTPGVEALALQDLNDRSRIILDDGLNIQNPDPVVYPDPKLTYTNTLRTGALVHNLMGVVDFRSNSYRIQPVETVEFSNTDDRPYEMDEIDGTIQVAAFNVLNYFTTLDTGAPICGPNQNMGCRGANTEFEFERQRTKIFNAILEMDADVVGLIEIENHITDTAVINIVAGLNDFAGGSVYDYINTGVIGTDAIKLAFIYQPATVTPVGDYAILDSSVDPRFLDTKNRPVLIQTFAENSSGELFTVAVNHLKSKGSPCDDVGDPDLGDGQGNCNVTRTEAAAALADYLATDPTGSGSDRFLIIGDLNSYAMEDPIMLLQDADYTDLLRFYYGDQAYSYVFDGQFGHLDYAMASVGIMPFVTGATAWHINADEPRVLDYNVEFKSPGQIIEWYSPEPFRSSDHDPIIVGPGLPLTVSILSPENDEVFVSEDGSAVSVPVIITTTDFTIPDDGHWHLILNGDDTGPVFGYETALICYPAFTPSPPNCTCPTTRRWPSATA